MTAKYLEHGKENKELVVMLHGGGVSYLGVEPTVQMASRIAMMYAECVKEKQA